MFLNLTLRKILNPKEKPPQQGAYLDIIKEYIFCKNCFPFILIFLHMFITFFQQLFLFKINHLPLFLTWNISISIPFAKWMFIELNYYKILPYWDCVQQKQHPLLSYHTSHYSVNFTSHNFKVLTRWSGQLIVVS